MRPEILRGRLREVRLYVSPKHFAIHTENFLWIVHQNNSENDTSEYVTTHWTLGMGFLGNLGWELGFGN